MDVKGGLLIIWYDLLKKNAFEGNLLLFTKTYFKWHMNDLPIVSLNKKRRAFYCKNWDCMYLVKMAGYYRYERKGDGIKLMMLCACILQCVYINAIICRC